MLIRFNVPVSTVIIAFGTFVCLTMALVMLKHRINQREFDSVALIAEDKHH